MSGSSWRKPCRWFWGSSWASSLWSRWWFTTSTTRWLPTRSRSRGTGPNISTWARGRWADSPQPIQPGKQRHFPPARGIHQHSSRHTELTRVRKACLACIHAHTWDGGFFWIHGVNDIALPCWEMGRVGSAKSWWLGFDSPGSNTYNSEEYLALKYKDWNHSSFGKTPLKVQEEHWMLCSLEHRWLILYYRQHTQNTASCSLQQDPWMWPMLLAGVLHVLWLSRECFTAPCTQRIHSTRACLM